MAWVANEVRPRGPKKWSSTTISFYRVWLQTWKYHINNFKCLFHSKMIIIIINFFFCSSQNVACVANEVRSRGPKKWSSTTISFYRVWLQTWKYHVNNFKCLFHSKMIFYLFIYFFCSSQNDKTHQMQALMHKSPVHHPPPQNWNWEGEKKKKKTTTNHSKNSHPKLITNNPKI